MATFQGISNKIRTDIIIGKTAEIINSLEKFLISRNPGKTLRNFL